MCAAAHHVRCKRSEWAATVAAPINIGWRGLDDCVWEMQNANRSSHFMFDKKRPAALTAGRFAFPASRFVG